MSHAALPETAGGRILRASSPRLLLVVSVAVVIIIATAAVLSFNSQMLLAAAGGIPAPVAWGWPLIVDGTIIVATVGVLILGSRGKGVLSYAWLILGVFGAISIWANGVHAMNVELDAWTKFAVGAVPPIALLLSTHLLVLMLTAPDIKIEQIVVRQEIPEPESEVGATDIARDEPGIPSAQSAPASLVSPVEPVAHTAAQSVPVATDSGEAEVLSEAEVEAWILDVLRATGEIPSGEAVGRRLGKSRSAGSRFRKALADREPEVAEALGVPAPRPRLTAV